ncbi:MAG: hypothetical protein IJM49_03925 [Firmicutes bacterium]|nr:hypothetical protein [Bacillota bacterium]
MNIKKALSLVAFGFLFTLVNVNLTLNGTALNITPDFIGWLLLFLAMGKLGSYAEGKQGLKWVFKILAVVTAAVWVMGIVSPWIELPYYAKLVINAVEAIGLFVLFGIMEKVAEDNGSERRSTLSILKYLNLILFIALNMVGVVLQGAILDGNITDANVAQSPYIWIFTLLGVAALVCAVITAVVLFGLRKEVNNMADAVREETE